MSEPRLWKWVRSCEEENHLKGEKGSFSVLCMCQLVLLKMVFRKATQARQFKTQKFPSTLCRALCRMRVETAVKVWGVSLMCGLCLQ